jgi:hypothetical protein
MEQQGALDRIRANREHYELVRSRLMDSGQREDAR